MNSIVMMRTLKALGQYSWITFSVDNERFQMVKAGEESFTLKRLVGEGEVIPSAVTFTMETCPIDMTKDLVELGRRQSDLGKGRKTTRKKDREALDNGEVSQ